MDFPDLGQSPIIEGLGVGKMPVPGTRTWPLGERWALHLFDYRAELRRGADVQQLVPGMITLSPPGTDLTFGDLERPSSHLYCTFLADRQPGTAPQPVTIPPQAVPPLLGERFASAVTSYPNSPRRATVRLWDILWDLQESVRRRDLRPAAAAQSLAHDASEYIELHLQTAIRVADIAAALGVSHNHLTRAFRSTFGSTVIGHLRRRRVERARQLLIQTDLPLKAIAIQVGFTDPHQFNKAVRHELGRNPSDIRSQHTTTS